MRPIHMAARGVRERCSGCGAAVSLESLTCEYCGAASPHAVRAKNARDEASLAQEEAELRTAQDVLSKSSTGALIWSVVGLVVCCLPIPGIIALVKGARVHRIAKQRGWIAPGAATAALILGGLNIVMFTGFSIFVAFEMRALSERKAALHAAVAESAGAEVLDQQTACLLAELRVLEDGYDDNGRTTTASETFECPGRVVQDGDRATLEALSFKSGGSDRIELDACLERGERWHVVELVEAGIGCGETEDAPSEE